MGLTSKDKTAIWVAIIGAIGVIAAAYFTRRPDDGKPPEPPVFVQYSNWKTETGHHKEKTETGKKEHNGTYGRGNLDITVSPPGKAVYLKICMKPKKSGGTTCISRPKAYETGNVSFELDTDEDWRLKEESVFFSACAYSGSEYDEKSKISCGDHEQAVHPRDEKDSPTGSSNNGK